jgi:phosphatidylserine/phosphatidylglycerophosphate/cardiolipin synthase-like enzyme
MRTKDANGGLTVNAVAGTYVVSLGFDLTDAARADCLGFAVKREDHTEHEASWMRGLKVFPGTAAGLGPGQTVSTWDHPIQAFQWADYAAKPAHDYTYTVVPRLGTPGQLTSGPRVGVRVQTEAELDGKHSVFFNRGAIASQEYARKFENIAPDKLTGEKQAAAYEWLSRGLLEALLAFIERATGADFALHGAIYEFKRTEVLSALKAAHDRDVDVQILYDAIPGETGPKAANEQAISDHGIAAFCTPRTIGSIMHNKFLVLSRDDQPVAVWTGSTNISENGIFGQLNVGHIVDDETTAEAYLAYWKQLEDDPETAELRLWANDNSPSLAPPPPPPAGTRTLMSPRRGLKLLDYYATLANSAGEALFMTFAFGMDERFRKVYDQDDDILRVALMEKEGNGASLAKAKVFIKELRRRRNVVVAVGKHEPVNALDRWKRERADGIGKSVDWVHTKFMLVDPLSQDPVVVSGSANFSEASTNQNDENMLVIRGDQRVADIYFGEFLRCFKHHSFREALSFGNPPTSQLHAKPADWQDKHFDPQTDYFLRRRYFAQTA